MRNASMDIGSAVCIDTRIESTSRQILINGYADFMYPMQIPPLRGGEMIQVLGWKPDVVFIGGFSSYHEGLKMLTDYYHTLIPNGLLIGDYYMQYDHVTKAVDLFVATSNSRDTFEFYADGLWTIRKL